MHHHLESFTKVRIAVIGDVMLDCYTIGEVSRVSPEAPVPVVRVTDERVVAGGAANVAVNLARLGIEVCLAGVTGRDKARDQLLSLLHNHGRIDSRGVIASDRATIRKLRVVGGRQQIVRIDHDDAAPLAEDQEAELVSAAIAAVDDTDLVILSDYGKGACSDAVLQAVFARASTSGKRVLVDPRRSDFRAYRGATLITPNRRELTAAAGLPCETDDEAVAAATAVQATCAVDILLTRSEKGMSFFPVSGEPIHLPTVAKDVFDVSGAGDTVVAMLGAALAASLPFPDAMRIANHAAGLVVSKLGTASVTREELSAALAELHFDGGEANGRLVTQDEALVLRARWAREKLSVGFANGCFDLLHPGHVALLKYAAQNCDRLIVALNDDASTRRLKGTERPIQKEQSRALVVGAIKGVAAVVLFAEDTPAELIKLLRPDLLVKGEDYRIEQVIGADVVLAGGGRVLLAPLVSQASTTALVRRASAPCRNE